MSTVWVSKSGWDAAYVFTCSGITITPLVGTTYTNNAQTFTVIGANIVTGAGNIFCSGTGAPSASGTLTKTGGTGDASITFSATPATGSTYAASKLTFGAGLTAAGAGPLIIGSGWYN